MSSNRRQHDNIQGRKKKLETGHCSSVQLSFCFNSHLAFFFSEGGRDKLGYTQQEILQGFTTVSSYQYVGFIFLLDNALS